MSETATKNAKPAKKEKAPKAPKPVKEKKTQEQILTEAENALIAKYPHVIKGSIRDVGFSKEHGTKRTVEVKCQYPNCGETRRLATSDLHQGKYCTEHTRVTRLERRKEARAAKQATKPAKAPKDPKPAKAPKAQKEAAQKEAVTAS